MTDGGIGNAGMMPSAATDRIFHSGGGPTPRHRPGSVESLAALLRDTPPSTRYGLAGRGTWHDAPRAPHATDTLDLSALSGIVEYVPGDLTLTALAATPLADIAAATAAHGQWLPLDPFGADGSLGATLATASTGPLAASIGHPRDVALGMEVVDGTGTRIRAGGRVVKNVAGFDLVRLQVGAWGTLGAVTEATVRLRALPTTDRTLALPVPPDPRDLGALLSSLRGLALGPLAIECLNASLASAIGLVARRIVLLRLAGNRASVDAALSGGTIPSTADEVDARVWTRLSAVTPHRATVARHSRRPSDIAGLWHDVLTTTRDGDLVHATVPRGIVRVMRLPGGDPRDLPRMEKASRIVEQGGDVVPALPEPIARLSARLRTAFDPQGRLNPGLLG